MELDLEEQITKLVKENHISEAILIAETELGKLPPTSFHKVIAKG